MLKLIFVVALIAHSQALSQVAGKATHDQHPQADRGNGDGTANNLPTRLGSLENPKASGAPQSDTQGKTRKTEQENTAVTGTPMNIHKDRWDYVYIGAGLLVAITTLILAIIAWRQAKTAKLAAESVMNAERPWVLVKAVGNPEDWYAPQKPAYSPGMVFQFKVYGKTPARIVSADFQLQPVPAKRAMTSPEADLPANPEYGDEIRRPEIPQEGMVLPPEQTFQVRLGLNPPALTEEQWIDLRDGNTIMCAYGSIRYEDAFGRMRETRTCYIYDFCWGGVITAPDGTRLNPPGFRVGGPPGYNRCD